ncbi:MAG: 2OG-Fe(II) oxygenase [Alphaproteobacteria bacterium]|nr:2OG-Fe(II) oxygenase [Alphaproteobacteria bacterium]
MSLLNIDAFRETPLVTEPFEYLCVPGFVRADRIAEILADYPVIGKGGSFPLIALDYGPVFAELCAELQGAALRDAFAEKFDMDLADRPTTLTVRGRCRSKDGKIHTDSDSKLITVLIYLNETWDADGGRLRLLRSPDSLDDALAELPPEAGSMVCFRNRENAWHGHGSFDGVRRVLQLNWVTDQVAVRQSERRHRRSAFWKRLNPFRRAA